MKILSPPTETKRGPKFLPPPPNPPKRPKERNGNGERKQERRAKTHPSSTPLQCPQIPPPHPTPHNNLDSAPRSLNQSMKHNLSILRCRPRCPASGEHGAETEGYKRFEACEHSGGCKQVEGTVEGARDGRGVLGVLVVEWWRRFGKVNRKEDGRGRGSTCTKALFVSMSISLLSVAQKLASGNSSPDFSEKKDNYPLISSSSIESSCVYNRYA